MRFITAIVLITLSELAVCRSDFGDRITSTKTADSVRQKLDLNEYLSSSNNQQPIKKLRPFQITNSQQKNIVNYATEQPSLIYTPLNIKPFSSEQHSPMPYSRPNIQQSSIYVPQNFSDSTFYNPWSSQFSYMMLLPLNCSELSPICLTPQLLHHNFSLRNSNSINSMTPTSLAHGAGLDMGINKDNNQKMVSLENVIPTGKFKPGVRPPTEKSSSSINSKMRILIYQVIDFYLMLTHKNSPMKRGRSLAYRGFPAATVYPDISIGYPESLEFTEFPGLSDLTSITARRPFSLFTTPNEIDLLPLNCSESSPTCLTPQRLPRQFTLADSKPFLTTSETRNLDDVTAKEGFLENENNNANVISNIILLKINSDSIGQPDYFPGFPRFSGPLGSPRFPGLPAIPGSPGFPGPSEPPRFPGLSGIPGSPRFPGSSDPSRFPGFLKFPEASISSESPGSPGPKELPESSESPKLSGSPGSPEFSGSTELPKFPGSSESSDQSSTTTEEPFSIFSLSREIETPKGVFKDDLNHPPHIHSLDVQCSKTMMKINIEFNRAFDGIIYSKGYFMNPECIYVRQNSGSTQYSFNVSLDSCGTQFINDFAGAAGQAYLENTLVLQNEPGVQEVWDTVRRVRCLWEGNINKTVTVNLSVDMLPPEIVTFNGDTATARLDIQIGKGPFAPAADGLVKIGETMTLVVSVEGDPGFDLQVRDCLARDEASTSILQLTDKRGCILKPKLMGAFQKTNITGNTGASIIAYAFFQAFKFPDVMDLFIECNVELCKTNCEPCPEANQHIEPGRRRRSVTYAPSSNNSTSSVMLSDPIRVGRRLKVIMLDDLSTASSQILDSMEEAAVEAMTKTKEVCVNNREF